MPGVARVITGRDLEDAGVKPIPNSADFRRADGTATISPPHRALAVDVVRYVGEAVAAVMAETPLAARDAAERVEVDYEPLPAVVDTAAALAPGAPRLADLRLVGDRHDARLVLRLSASERRRHAFLLPPSTEFETPAPGAENRRDRAPCRSR